MEQQHAYLAFSVCCTVKSSLKFDSDPATSMNSRFTAKDFRHSLTVCQSCGWANLPHGRRPVWLSGVMSPPLGSADVGANIAAARRLTKKPALDKRFEERPTRLRFKVPQALCLMLGERQTRHLEILASNALHDRFNGISFHVLAATTLDSMSVNRPLSSQRATGSIAAQRAEIRCIPASAV